ncbi:MAG: peptidyl-prolyl cis-trans isomerase [Polyangiales bacterium]
MSSVMDRWRASPLARFVVLGALLFALDAWRSRARAPRRDAITVTSDFVAGLREGLRRERGREPTPDEVEARVQEHVREEALYRHALALGLDRGDVIVRRRLAQKAAYLIEAESEPPAPTAEQLRAWYAAHPERYAEARRITLEHRYFSRERRGERARADAANDDAGAGDPFLRGERFVDVTPAELDGVFGEGFTARATALREGEWTGPVESALGWHRVRWVAVPSARRGLRRVAEARGLRLARGRARAARGGRHPRARVAVPGGAPVRARALTAAMLLAASAAASRAPLGFGVVELTESRGGAVAVALRVSGTGSRDTA